MGFLPGMVAIPDDSQEFPLQSCPASMKEGRKPVIIEATLPPTPDLLSSAKAGSEKLQRHCIGLDLL